MNWIAPLWREWQLVYYSAALRSINPLHDDVPHIVRRLNELRSERPAAQRVTPHAQRPR